MELDPFWQLFCKDCLQNENKLAIVELVIFFRNSVIHPSAETLDIAVFLVIFIIELQDSSVVWLCHGLHGRISVAPTALPDPLPFFSSFLSVVCSEIIPSPVFFPVWNSSFFWHMRCVDRRAVLSVSLHLIRRKNGSGSLQSPFCVRQLDPSWWSLGYSTPCPRHPAPPFFVADSQARLCPDNN